MMKTHTYILLLTVTVLAACGTRAEKREQRWLAAEQPEVTLYERQTVNGKKLKEERLAAVATALRGSEVTAFPSERLKLGDLRYIQIRYGKKRYYVLTSQLTDDPQQAVQERFMYCRTPASVVDDTLTSHICSLAQKGEAYPVAGYDRMLPDGRVNRYRIRIADTCGYVYAKYMVRTEDEALARYMPELYDSIHSRVRNTFGGGEAIGCDFYPVDKPRFADNPMPEAVYSLYLNISPAAISRIDSFIDLARQTHINAFVLDMKDNECPAYKAETFERYSPTNYKWGGAGKLQMYEYAVRRLKQEGFYVIGRITCFKDTYFVRDHPECAITERSSGQPFFHNKAHWPSAYDRRVWQFNVELAKECVRRFGLNEINFDYVRFPDKMQSVESAIDYHNTYGESKVQAIQRFVQYACDEIHALGAYVSIDVFGETTNKGYTTPYGQYWPALSNVADVMCGMPYPDHFANGYGGIQKPWNNPYRTLNTWGRNAQSRQQECPTPAVVRTWVQAYHVMHFVDPNGIDYNGENIAREIRGLYDAGCTGGYITWLSNSSLAHYRKKADAFRPDYLEEWKARQDSIRQAAVLENQEKAVPLQQ